jgi:hypothetical protein
MKLLTMQFPPISYHFIPLWSDILLSTLFSDSFSSFLNITDQVSQPYKTTGNIMVLCKLIFTFLDSRREDRKVLNK